MLRRQLIVCMAAAMAGCTQEPSATLVDVPLSEFQVTLGDDAEASFLDGLERFAAANGLDWWTDTMASEMGVRRVFEMRRRDLRIFGSNSVREYGTDIPVTPDGRPDIEFDPSLYRVYFYRAASELNRTTLAQVHASFVQTFEPGSGITVSPLRFRETSALSQN